MFNVHVLLLKQLNSISWNRAPIASKFSSFLNFVVWLWNYCFCHISSWHIIQHLFRLFYILKNISKSFCSFAILSSNHSMKWHFEVCLVSKYLMHLLLVYAKYAIKQYLWETSSQRNNLCLDFTDDYFIIISKVTFCLETVSWLVKYVRINIS